MSWKLNIGCHRGTVTSRDSDVKTMKYGCDDKLESLQDCKDCAEAWRKNWASIGYQVWFATAIAPDGTVTDLQMSTRYS